MKKITVLLLLMAVILSFGATPVAAASEVPYQTYTFDKWGNATPASNGYMPTRSIGGAQLGCGNFNGAMDMFYNEALGLIFIADTGNDRIVILREDMSLEKVIDRLEYAGGEYLLNQPQGVFALDDGTLYICDTGNQEIVVCDADGRLLSKLPTPSSTLLPENFHYQPTRIVVDDAGRMYIISKGTYQGLIYLDTDGSFIKFFGANNVEMTLRRRILKIWKSILPDEAASTMQSFNPIEYGNIYMSSDGYIYATAAGSENGAALMTKLNPLGIDCLPYKLSGTSLYADVSVDDAGVITALDTNNGLIVQVDENGKNMFTFGGLGDQTGLFRRAVSLIEVGGALYVMDADKNTITEFCLTAFGETVRNAIGLYNEGLYRESIEPWKNVITHNANYLLAYTGLGKAYYQLEDYDTAMYYYKLANDRSNYSQAYREASLNHMRDAFGLILLGMIAVIAGFALLRKYLRSREIPLGEAIAAKWKKIGKAKE